jgi:hypothetical protein
MQVIFETVTVKRRSVRNTLISSTVHAFVTSNYIKMSRKKEIIVLFKLPVVTATHKSSIYHGN